MQSSSFLALQLSATHGVVVYHATVLAPEKLAEVFNRYGKPSIVRSYDLTDGNYATLVFFAEPSDNAACYASLSLLSLESGSHGLISVGWMHENGEEAFSQQPYIKCKHTPKAGHHAPATPATTPASTAGYLVVFWKGVPSADRAAVTQLAAKAAQEVFEDEKEGGRSFYRFTTEDAANTFHSRVKADYASLLRSISYADATDFSLAKQSG